MAGSAANGVLLRVVNVRPGEVRALLFSFAYFFFLMGGYAMLRPVRDQMAIAHGLQNLKFLFLYTFIAMLVAAPLYGALVARAAKAQIVPVVYRFFIVNLIAFWVFILATGAPAKAGTVFFVWLSVFNLFVVSVFWSLMNDLYSSEQGKRLFGFVAAGGSLGALVGPVVVVLLAKAIGPVHLLLIAAAFLEISLLCMRFVVRAADPPAEPAEKLRAADRAKPIGGGVLGGLKLILGSPYLAGVALFFLFMTGVATFLYYTQAHFIRAATVDPAERTQIFALFDIVAQALTFAIQLFIAGRLFKRFGIGWGLTALPLIVAAGFALMAFGGTTLVMLAGFQAIRRAAQYALTRPARENLFTPLDAESKYKAKNFIDTAVYRGGDAGSIWIFSWLRAVGVDFAAMAGWMVVVAGLWLATAFLLGRRHAKLEPGAPVPQPAASPAANTPAGNIGAE
jgi:AAA family ATP:ADP antiporter